MAKHATKKAAPEDVAKDSFLERVKRHRLGALAILVGTIVVGIGSFFGAVGKIWEFVDKFSDSKPTTITALQESVRATALELKKAFDSTTTGRTPPLSDWDLRSVIRLVSRIENLDPENGHGIYYRGFIARWQGHRQESHNFLFRYLENANGTAKELAGDNGDLRFCYDNWLGFCVQRRAYIYHVLALDFERSAVDEKSDIAALETLKTSLRYAGEAIRLEGGFNDPLQGPPTLALIESVKQQIIERSQGVEKLAPAKR